MFGSCHTCYVTNELNLGSGIPGCLPHCEEELLSPHHHQPLCPSLYQQIHVGATFDHPRLCELEPQNSLSLSIPSRLHSQLPVLLALELMCAFCQSPGGL